MLSKKLTLAVPHPLLTALEKHALEVGYTDVHQLFLWSAFYSLLVGKPHIITAPIAQSPIPGPG
jgi:hypothetical protein